MPQPDASVNAGSPGVLSRLRRYVTSRRAEASRKQERARLLAMFPKGGVGAEVGSWKGDFASQLLTVTRPRQLYLIDPWEHREEDAYEHALFGGEAGDGHAKMEAVYRGVLDRFGAEIEHGQVFVRRSRSGEAAADLADDSLDWVYIDGDHTYDAVKADLEAYHRVVRPGGLLAGDDYGLPGWWESGVTRAVDEFTASGRCDGPTIIGSQFIFTKS
jgi:SAM-dependent methyltransferase